MPTTKKEGIYFGLMMCFGMVIVMTVYNLFINDLFSVITLKTGIIQFLVTFLVALLFESLIVGPFAKKIVFMLPFDKSKMPLVIIAMSTCMVLGMVFFMSLYSLVTTYLNQGLTTESYVTSYFLIFIKNFVFAYPLQLLVMGPLVRFLFVKFVRGNKALSV
ncbi:MAG: putative rane protein [Brevibacillus sp.]|nr:putative rane protein [Brevibacillus sp.]